MKEQINEILINQVNTEYKEVNYGTTFDIAFDNREAIQIMEGAKLLKEAPTKNQFDAYVILTNAFCTQMQRIKNNRTVFKDFPRKYVSIWRQFLSLRMQHCEKEQAEGSKRFNLNTYICQIQLHRRLTDALSISFTE